MVRNHYILYLTTLLCIDTGPKFAPEETKNIGQSVQPGSSVGWKFHIQINKPWPTLMSKSNVLLLWWTNYLNKPLSKCTYIKMSRKFLRIQWLNWTQHQGRNICFAVSTGITCNFAIHFLKTTKLPGVEIFWRQPKQWLIWGSISDFEWRNCSLL